MSENSPNAKGIESVFKFSSLVYIFFLTCGLTYNYFYYKNFGIYINEYIDLAEALLLFVPMLANGFVIAAAIIVVWHLMNHSVLFGSGSGTKPTPLQRQTRRTLLATALAGLILIVVLFILNQFNVFSSYGLYMYLVGIIVIFLPTLLEELFLLFQTEQNASSSKLFRDVIYMLIVFLAITIWISYSKTQRVFRKNDAQDFYISFNNRDTIIKSDANTCLLGRTSKYIFIYRFKEKLSTVLNVSDVKEFVISPK